MEGRITEITRSEGKGKVDTRNDHLGIPTIYRLTDEVRVDSTVEFDIVTSAKGNTYARFISLVERNQVRFNTEDRDRWYEWGENDENDFITNVVPRFGLDIRKNPEKELRPWAIDMFDYTNYRYADLKTQNTPFFTCLKYMYNGRPYDPNYTVTFNRKDYEHYLSHYPECDIYFWINWTQCRYKNICVQPIHGVWRASFARMAEMIQAGTVVLHAYIHRTDDDHNAKDSFLLNLLDESVFHRMI